MKIEKILTENPYEEMWNYLGYFKSYKNCYNYLNNVNNVDFRQKRAYLLKYLISQAHEYFLSYKRVSMLTQPTLLYYGILSLSRFSVLIKRGHPDSTKSHGVILTDQVSPDLFDFKVRITRKGTFSELYKTIYIEDDYYSDFKLIKGTEWSLKELFSMVPEINNLFEETFNAKSLAIKIEKFVNSGYDDCLRVNESFFDKMDEKNIDEFLCNIKHLDKYYLPPQHLSNSVKIFYKRPSPDGDIIKTNIMREEYLISGIQKGTNIIIFPEIIVHFLILYILSMLSRYHINEWGIENFEDKQGYFYIVQQFLNISERKFPNLILNLISNKDYVFTTETYTHSGSMFNNIKEQLEDFIEEWYYEKTENK